MHRKHLDVGGVRLAYTVEPGEPWILYLHGSGANRTQFNDYIPYFRGLGYGQILPDLRGDGRSSALPDSAYYSLAHYEQDILSILAEEKIESAIIVGTSLGGLIALSFAARHPAKTEAVIALSASRHFARSFATTRLRRFLMRGEGLLRVADLGLNGAGALFNYERERFYPDFSSEKMRKRPDWLIYLTLIWRRSWTQQRSIEAQIPLRHVDISSELKSVRAPVLLAHAQDDPLIPPVASEELAQLLPNAERPLIFASGGHGLVSRNAEEILPKMERFLRRHAKRT